MARHSAQGLHGQNGGGGGGALVSGRRAGGQARSGLGWHAACAAGGAPLGAHTFTAGRSQVRGHSDVSKRTQMGGSLSPVAALVQKPQQVVRGIPASWVHLSVVPLTTVAFKHSAYSQPACSRARVGCSVSAAVRVANQAGSGIL